MKLAEIIINNPDISKINVPYIIAEAGVNHEGNFQNAINLIDLAADGGAHAIKFQTYKAETLASKNSPSYWDLNSEKTDSQYKLFKKYDKFWKSEYEKLYLHCLKKNIEFISTPFDLESANFLNDIMPVFKISSSDITNKIFIEHICGFKKPIILSTGASNLDEIKKTVHLIQKRNIPLSLLHCILNYPTLDDNANLGMILELKSEFNECCIGYSDHTLPNLMDNLIYATLLGAKIIEKHFTLNKLAKGADHRISVEPKEFKLMVNKIRNLETMLGSGILKPTKEEYLKYKHLLHHIPYQNIRFEVNFFDLNFHIILVFHLLF